MDEEVAIIKCTETDTDVKCHRKSGRGKSLWNFCDEVLSGEEKDNETAGHVQLIQVALVAGDKLWSWSETTVGKSSLA